MKASRIGILAAFAGALVAVPFFLPRRVRVVRRLLIQASPPEIFPFLNDLRNWPLWTAWSRRGEIHLSYERKPAGVGAVQRWRTRRTEGALKITVSVPDVRVAYDVDFAPGRRRLEGVLALEPVLGWTLVTWTCRWPAKTAPWDRYASVFLVWWIGRDFAAGLRNLKTLIESHRVAATAEA